MEPQRPKLADVARVAGVSRATASRAMNGLPGTTEAVRRRVREVAAQLGFQPHAAARALATGRSTAGRLERIEILIVDPDPDALSVKPYYGRVLTGAMRALEGQDVSLQVRRVATPPAGDDDPPFGQVLINMPVAAAARARRTRTIALGETAPGIPFVAPDNDGGGHQAAEHLVTSGRRRIGAVFGPPTPCAQERKAGFLRVMAGAAQPVASIDGDFTRARAYAAARELLAREPRLDAVFAACDVSAMGSCRRCARPAAGSRTTSPWSASTAAPSPRPRTCPRSTCPSRRRPPPRSAACSTRPCRRRAGCRPR